MPRGEIDEVARLERRHDDERPGAVNHGVHKRDETGHMAHGNGERARSSSVSPIVTDSG